jgi:uncharacterized protein (TIGR02246 family)
LLPQNPDDLLFRESACLHVHPPGGPIFGGISGAQVNGFVLDRCGHERSPRKAFAGSKLSSSFRHCGSRLPLTTKRKQTIALLSKLRRSLNVIHGNDRFTKFNKARGNSIMRTIALVIAFAVGLIATASAQKAEIEAVNAKWTEFFNKGDFAGIASLYTTDATAFPPGSAMVQGGAAIGAMWKSMAEQVSDPKVTTLDVKPLGPSAAREIGTFSLKTKGPTPQEVTGKYVVVWEKVGNEWKLAADIWNDGN